MDTPKKNVQMEKRENWTRENRRASFIFGNEVITEISSSCPSLISPDSKVNKKNIPRKRLTSEVINSAKIVYVGRVGELRNEAAENGPTRIISKSRNVQAQNAIKPENDDCFELELLLHKMEYKYLRLQLELEENKIKLAEVTFRNELLQSQFEMISSENAFLKTANQKTVIHPNFITPRKANKIIIREEDREWNEELLQINSEVKIQSKTETLSLVLPSRRASNVSPTSDFKETSRSLSPCRWENNSLIKINRVFEETNVAELRKLLVASIVESEVLLSKLEEAENRRLETLNQAEKSQSDLNDKIAQLKNVKQRAEIVEKSELKEELTLARNELHCAKERVDRLENEFVAIKLKLDKTEEGTENPKLNKEVLGSKPEKRRERSKIKSVFNFVKDIFAAPVDSGQIDATPVKARAVSLTLGQDVLNDTELDSDPFNHCSKFQASTPKRLSFSTIILHQSS